MIRIESAQIFFRFLINPISGPRRGQTATRQTTPKDETVIANLYLIYVITEPCLPEEFLIPRQNRKLDDPSSFVKK